ncbi:MAG: helix-turn-helix transcriptional regulator [Kiritimatiellae bacterium]|nr:helix-turn-helix transcriptional regulator [Kiritimatiellia bacterium]
MKPKCIEEYEKAADAIRQTDVYKEERVKADFTERIWNRLREMNLTQAEFARRLGVSPARVTKILDGSANFTFRTAIAISTALGMDFEAALVPKNGCASAQGRIAIGFVEGACRAKVNSSWRDAVFAPPHAPFAGSNESVDHEYASAAIG